MISVGSVVQIYPGPPRINRGELAQLGERLVCNQEVTGSSPVFSTSFAGWPKWLIVGGSNLGDDAHKRGCPPKRAQQASADAAWGTRGPRVAAAGGSGRSPKWYRDHQRKFAVVPRRAKRASADAKWGIWGPRVAAAGGLGRKPHLVFDN